MFVLDTNVVAELRKIRSGKADPHVAHWADNVDAGSLHISAITILELEIGILQIVPQPIEFTAVADDEETKRRRALRLQRDFKIAQEADAFLGCDAADVPDS